MGDIDQAKRIDDLKRTRLLSRLLWPWFIDAPKALAVLTNPLELARLVQIRPSASDTSRSQHPLGGAFAFPRGARLDLGRQERARQNRPRDRHFSHETEKRLEKIVKNGGSPPSGRPSLGATMPLLSARDSRARAALGTSSWRSLQDPYGLFHPSKHALFSATHTF